MKVRFRTYWKGITGKVDDKVFYYHPGLKQTLARSITQPCRNPSASRLKQVMANLRLINPSAAYRQDLKDYAILYNNLKVNRSKAAANWMNLYMKMLYAMAKATPGLDLAELTREQIYAQALPCLSVKTAVEADLLPWVRGWYNFTKEI
jgi:hypothetical protein